jgi:hypothetical protein
MVLSVWIQKILQASLMSTLVLCTFPFSRSPTIAYFTTTSQLFPDQVQYFPKLPKVEFGTQAIIQGSDWIALHGATATL